MSNEKPLESTDGIARKDHGNDPESVQLGLKQLWWFSWAAFLVLAALSATMVYFLLPKDLQDAGGKFRYCVAYFLASFMASLGAAAVVYLMSYLWIRRWRDIQYKQLAESLVVTPIEKRIRLCVSDCLKEWSTGDIREYESLRGVEWKDVILSAETTIDICVQGWDGLVSNNRAQWAKFFREKNGQVNLFLPFMPNSIEESNTLSHMAKRLNREGPEQAEEIRNTLRLLQRIRAECGSGKVVHYPVKNMIWYCLIRVDNKVAYLSLYEHVHGEVTDSPTFEIRLDRFPVTKSWIDKEINGLQAAVDIAP